MLFLYAPVAADFLFGREMLSMVNVSMSGTLKSYFCLI